MIPNLPGVNHPSRWCTKAVKKRVQAGWVEGGGGGRGGPGVICDTKGASVKGKV